jgi:hypothetical protein
LTKVLEHLLTPITTTGGHIGSQWWKSSTWLWVYHPGSGFWIEQLPFVIAAILVSRKVGKRHIGGKTHNPAPMLPPLTNRYQAEGNRTNRGKHESTPPRWLRWLLIFDDDLWS